MRLITWLRSRRLAAWLLVGITAYACVSTLVPLESVDPAAVVRWDAEHPLLAAVVQALGLHRAFSSPVFLAAAALLTMSTAACAWERSRDAWRSWKVRGRLDDALLRRLREAPTFAVRVPDPDARPPLLDDVADALRGLRMRVRSGPSLVEGSSGAIGLVGSPLFHWALAGLFLAVGVGQLTRYEGYANVPAGESVTDAAGSYAVGLFRGPAGGGYTGVTIRVAEVRAAYEAGGIARGATPRVEVLSGGTVVASRWVYPNSPLVYGPLVVHRAEAGPAFIGTVRSTATSATAPVVLYFPGGSSVPRSFDVGDPSRDETLTVHVVSVPGGRVGISVEGDSSEGTRTAAVAESVDLGGGLTLTVDELTSYAQLRVVNDGAVPWVYAMFALGLGGAAVTVFVRPRSVRVLVPSPGDAGEAPVVKVLVHCTKTDPAFPGVVRRAMERRLDALEPDAEEGGEGS